MIKQTESWHGCKGRLVVELPSGTVTLNVVVNLTKAIMDDGTVFGELTEFTFNGVADGPPLNGDEETEKGIKQ